MKFQTKVIHKSNTKFNLFIICVKIYCQTLWANQMLKSSFTLSAKYAGVNHISYSDREGLRYFVFLVLNNIYSYLNLCFES